MAQHFPLLQVEAKGLTGTLAPVMDEEAAKHRLTVRALRILSRLLPSKRVELLGIMCSVDGDGVFHAEPTGLLAEKVGRKVVEGVVTAVRDKGWPVLRRNGRLIFTTYEPAVPSAAAMKVLASRMIYEKTDHPRAATATLQVTARCQADCYHGGAARHRHRFKPDLTTEQWKSIIRQTEDLGVVNIVFTGGEPLLRRDIFELISWVRKDESNAMMFTDGLLLTEENVKKLVDAGLFSVNVSIDSPDPEAHNELRKVPRCFERALEGLWQAQEAGLIVGISTYATPERLRNGQVMPMIELAREAGAHEITIFDVLPTGKLLQEDTAHLLSDADKRELTRIEEEWNAKRELPHVITQAHVNSPEGAGCCAGWFQFYMTAYGDMTPCDFTPLTMGNATRESVETLWNRLASHPAYANHCNHCRMQDASFRAKYIDRIPEGGPFPFPIAVLDKMLEVDRPIASEVNAGGTP